MTTSEEETVAVGRLLARELAPDGTLLLYGDLGSGKTVLARGVAAGLGIDSNEVQSPTFTLIREHEGRGGSLIHIDLYRLAPDQVEELGLDELLATSAVKVIEWAERLPARLAGDLRLELGRGADARSREIREVASRPMDSDSEG